MNNETDDKPIELPDLPGVYIHKDMIPKLEAIAKEHNQAIFNAMFDPNRKFPEDDIQRIIHPDQLPKPIEKP